tara:strand:- start:1327 stop:1710 length:384 start_codon:yes stop_codon:yes gene_type:complete
MATVSTDISEKIDIECRKSDTFYLAAILEKGSLGSMVYMNLESFTEITLVVKNANDNSVLELYKTSGTNSGVKYYETITDTGSGGAIMISATSDAMNIPEGTYTYTCKISKTGFKNTVMHGKFKVVD